MKNILLWTDRSGWLSRESYPEIYRRFEITPLDPETTGELSSPLIVDDIILREQTEAVRRLARDSRPFDLPVIVTGDSQKDGEWDDEDLVFDVLSETPSETELLRSVRKASHLLESEQRLLESQAAAEQRARELEQLHAIGVALSGERDHNRLLTLILSKSREITKADAGSLFLMESIDEPIGPEDKKGDQSRVTSRWLVFRLAQNDSREFKFHEEILEVTPASIAGYVALTRKTLMIEDAYDIPKDQPFTFNRHYDETTGYRCCSMLVVPMQNREGETIGVLQLINKKRDADERLTTPECIQKEVLPFTPTDEQLLCSLASQAAIAVENNALYQRIETLFANFVEASVVAIESRDPVTKGHSRRVARMTVELARITNEAEFGAYRDFRLSDDQIRELKYASLLHDFGKVGVKENVLQKENKLLSGKLGEVRERFNTIRRTIEVQHLRRLLDRLLRGGEITEAEIQQLDDELKRKWDDVDRAWAQIIGANQPSVVHSSGFEGLQELGQLQFPHLDGRGRPYLEPQELTALRITKGTLTRHERLQINEHVEHTYDFLSKIPWTRDLQSIPKIARGHHEKLDGSGYPHHLISEEIPPQTRMMTISDIYDALAAQDRPYKPRVPTEATLDILREEAEIGQLDKDLLELFIEAKVFRLATHSS